MPKRGGHNRGHSNSRGGGGHRGGRGGGGRGGKFRGRGARSGPGSPYARDDDDNGSQPHQHHHHMPGRGRSNKRNNRGGRGGGGSGGSGRGGPGAVYQILQASKQQNQLHHHHRQYHGKINDHSLNHDGKSRKRGQPVEIKFSRATERVNHSMTLDGDNDDDDDDEDDDDDSDMDDEGFDNDIGSDESNDGSEDGYFMEGEFEWEEADRDPDLKRKMALEQARILAEEKARIAREAFVPLTSWGGALTYMTKDGISDNTNEKDENEKEKEGTTTTITDSSAQESIDPMSPSPSAKQHQKQIQSTKVQRLDFTKEIESRMKSTETTTTHSATTMTVATDDSSSSSASASTTTTAVAQESSTMWILDPTPSTTIMASSKSDLRKVVIVSEEGIEEEEDMSMMWVIDTEPSDIGAQEQTLPVVPAPRPRQRLPVPPPAESFIELSPERDEMFYVKKPKANRSKRGGRKLKEKERLLKLTRQVAAGDREDDLMLLEEPESEVDEDMLALEDYLQNTTDPDNPDQFNDLLNTLSKGGLSGGFGHSSNIGGLDPDDSDFLQEDDFEDDSNSSMDGGDDDDMDYIGRTTRMRTQRKTKSGKQAFFDSDDDDVLASSATGGRKSKTKHVPHGVNFETLSELNSAIEDFVRDDGPRELQLPPMPKALRRKVHMLAENFYNLRSQSLGSGKKRSPMLVKTHQTRIPPNPVDIHKLLVARSQNQQQQQQGSKHMNDRSRKERQAHRGQQSQGQGQVHGKVVGAEASALSIENKGHRMLAKMG
ncbi:hypothetical protein BG004_001988 [Podila humilis]|nr:hypothetical protein BG004_001988 [Podila humilis]